MLDILGKFGNIFKVNVVKFYALPQIRVKHLYKQIISCCRVQNLSLIKMYSTHIGYLNL